MSFLSAGFLGALVAVAGPLAIHLLNRRRFRTLEWAAMDFLRDAVKRNKRILDIRDLILLLLRTLAVLFFVLAMARPYWSASGAAVAGRNQPVHAVVAIDNSLSMGYTELDKSLLDIARDRADAFLRSLPANSQVSLVVMCPSSDDQGRLGSLGVQDAIEALDQVHVVDRQANLTDAAEQVRAMLALPGAPGAKYVVFFSDMQAQTWSASGAAQVLKGVSPIHVVQVGQPGRDNTCVADFRLRDGIADAQSPAVFIATLRHFGTQPHPRLRVSLKIDHQVVEERQVDLEPNQPLEVMFKYRFTAAGTPHDPLFVPATVELEHDHLAMDDSRSIIVPVVASVPVVFVDQLGAREDPSQNRFGDTLPLRRLLAPRSQLAGGPNQLVQVRHITPDQITREVLKDARLTVIAGVRSISPETDRLLRQYVEQGGQLIIAAGGDFDPVAWDAAAWRSGAGVLPLPLRPQLIGQLPTADHPNIPTFHLDPRSFDDPLFRLALPQSTYQDLLASPFFFMSAAVDEKAPRPDSQVQRARLEQARLWLADADELQRHWADLASQGKLTEDDRRQRARLAQVRQEMGPRWVLWSNPLAPDPWLRPMDQLLAQSQPRIIGRYTNGQAFAVRRDLGRGTILLITTGIFPLWNNMAVDQSVLLFDHAMRAMLAHTLPTQTFGPRSVLTIPLESRDLGATFTLQRPGAGPPVPLLAEALGERAYGLRIRYPVQRGIYTIRRTPGPGEAADPAGQANWTLQLAVNGPAEESDLTPIDAKQLAQRLSPLTIRWVNPGESIAIASISVERHDLWRYLMLLALLCLAAEMAFLAFGRSFSRRNSA